MKLLRYAIAEFSERIPRMALWANEFNGVQVRIEGLENAEQVPLGAPLPQGPTFMLEAEGQDPTRALIVAATSADVRALNELEVAFDADARERAEEALRFTAASLAIQAQVACHLYSPTPYIVLQGESVVDRDLLAGKLRVVLPRPRTGVGLAGPGLEWPVDLTMLSDRPDGVRLLGAAISASHGVAKLHELFRLFEHAFSRAGAELSGPLFNFLDSHPWELGYSASEVAGWVTGLRHPSTHADLRQQKRFLMDQDVEQHLPRIEQAAHDVLYNKRVWHSPGPEREERNPLRCAIKSDGETILTDGARMRATTGWDLHDAFPLRGRLDFPAVDQPEWGIIEARWYFSDAARHRLRTVGTDL